MKTVKILLFIMCFSSSMFSQTEESDKNILKVNYTSGCVSDFFVGLIKKQIPNADEASDMLAMMSEYKVHSTFYHNMDTKESVFVFDSISEVEHLNTTGYTHSIYKNHDGEIFGKEEFMGKEIDFKGTLKDIKWTITKEEKEINGYKCKKALVNDNEEMYAWFTPEIAVNGGPYVFIGLPGLVLESNSPFEAINVSTISYANSEEFQNRVNSINANNSKDEISITEVFAKKENFQRMLAGGTD